MKYPVSIICIISVLILITSNVRSQAPVGTWTDRLSYYTSSGLAVTSDKVYSSTGASLLVYDKSNSELKSLSRINGLSETWISTIGWSQKTSTLIITYHTLNVDLIKGNSIYNLQDISTKYLNVNKSVYRIRCAGKYAYLCTSFGIVIIDLVKKEVHDTWKPGPDPDYNEVYDIAFGNGKVFAATASGVWFADSSVQGLSYYANWNQLYSIPEPDVISNLLLYCGDRLYFNIKQPLETGDIIYSHTDETKVFSFIPKLSNLSIDSASGGFTVTSQGMMRYFGTDGSLLHTISSYSWGSPTLCQAVLDIDNIWLADKGYGLIMTDKSSDFQNLSIPGPVSNYCASISSSSGKTIICGGGFDILRNGLKRDLMVSVYENNRFFCFSDKETKDALRACIASGNNSRFFVSSWGDGLFEYDNNGLIKQYTALNSPLGVGIVSGAGIKIMGLAIDQLKNLWITQTDASASIKVLKPDGSWIIYPVNIDAPVIGDIIATGKSQKWVILPDGYGLFVLDDNNTPGIFTDDKYRRLTVVDSDNKEINYIFSLAEDMDGNIWIGTDKGPVIYYDPDKIFEEDIRGHRIKIPRNDGSGLADFLLGTETITSIAVDGANRKWLGTKSSGVYLLASDGASIIKNYNELNSPLYSDSITSVAVDNITGEVWFGTSKGVLSIRELATEGDETYDNVYSFPNPVREDYHGNVTITGLIKDTQIKITDISGNLVFETFSEGGQASWDLTTFDGHRIKTGVYLIFCSDMNSSKAFVTKILVIRK
jgi:hypothetical protein